MPADAHRGALATLLALAGVVTASPAAALRYGVEPAHVALAPGVAADRVARPCTRYGGTSSCFYWRFEGLAAGAAGETLATAQTLASARGGRIVAALASGEIVLSDDRGATLRRAAIEGPQRPLAIAFDATGEFGAAVGTGGAVWTSNDAGEHWRARRDGGLALYDVAIAGRTLVWLDEQNGVAVSSDDGLTARTITAGAAGAPRATLESGGHAVRVRVAGGGSWRVDAGGSVERDDGTLHGGPLTDDPITRGHNPAH